MERGKKGRTGAIQVIAVALSLFHLYTGAFGTFIPMIQRPVHLAFTSVLVFLIFPSSFFRREGFSLAWDVFLAVVALAVSGFFAWNGQRIMAREPFVDLLSPADLAMGGLLLLVVVEGTRRAVGWPLTVTALIFLFYGYAGPLFPGVLNHRGVPVEDLLDQMVWSDNGVFGIPLGVSATYVVLFIILGAFINKGGTGALFRDLAFAVAGGRRGGPAKVAVLFSALFGSVTGSSVANVYGTGTVTIPMMKKVGYAPEVAGGIEATASCGGQIMPPVMGAAAFIMAEFLGIPYIRLLGYALIPAFLYFFSVLMMVHFHALRKGILGERDDGAPSVWRLLGTKGYLLLPLVGLIYLLIAGYSPMWSALVGVLLSCGVTLVGIVLPAEGEERITARVFLDALETGGRWTVSMSLATASAGIIIGTISQSGLGYAFVDVLLGFSGGVLFGALLFCMVSVMILGMGMPTTVSYIMAVALAAPALVKFGVAPIVAHMFIFYFAVFANITPPVAIAAYAAASIARADFMATAVWAIRIGMAAVIIPYMFVYSPALLGIGNWGAVGFGLATAVLGVVFLASAAEGYLFGPMGYLARLLLGLGALGLIHPSLLTDALAAVAVSAVAVPNFQRHRAPGLSAVPPEPSPAGLDPAGLERERN